MWDETQRGWLAGDDYRAAVERAGVVELPDDGRPAEPAGLSDLTAAGRWEDDNPPGTPA